MHMLLTGRPGCGKTTIVRKVVSRLPGLVGGFYTQEIREHGRRVGFEIKAIDGRKGILAHKSGEGTYFVKDDKTEYQINLKDLKEIAADSVYSAIESNDIVVVDEIGHMELFSDEFRDAVSKAFDSGKVVFATISKYGGPFEEDLKKRDDVLLFEVTQDNRGSLPDDIAKKIKG